MNAFDADEPRVLVAGGRTFIHVLSGRGEELRLHLESHGIRSRLSPALAPRFQALDVEGGADQGLLEAILDEWEG